METPRLDAELLVGHVLDMDRLELYLSYDRPVSPAERDRLRPLMRERGRHVPVAYLLGRKEFHGLEFEMERGVLVPRPETEHLVEVALGFLEDLEAPSFVDVGCGTGCVAISVLHALSAARAEATDTSAAACALTRRNAQRHDVAERLRVHEGDLLAPLPPGATYDAVLSNPPYIAEDDPEVERGVRDHEPPEALFVPDGDPLHFVRRLAVDARDVLRPGGLLAAEVGASSGADAQAVLEHAGYVDVASTQDLAGIDRIVHGRRP